MTQKPRAKMVEYVRTLHGVTWTDTYAWLQKKEDPQVLSYLTAENTYADTVQKPQLKLQKKLYKEMKAHMKETDMSVPVTYGEYEYYTKTKKGKQYALHFRKHVATKKEELLLDENELAKGKSYFDLGRFEVSPNHELLAYSIDTNGDEKHTLMIQNLATGELLKETITEVGDIEWTADCKSILYSKEEHPHPPRKIFMHTLGTNVLNDILIYEEKDPQWYVHLSKSSDEKYIFIGAGSFDTSEIRFVDAHKPDQKPILFAERVKKVKYFPEHYRGDFYILTNEKAREFKILRTSVEKPGKHFWRPWMPHNSKVSISGFSVYETFFALTVRRDGREEIFITNPEREKEYFITLPERERSVSLWGNIEYSSPYIRFTFESFTSPKTVCDYWISKKKIVTRKKQEVPQWDQKDYVTERLLCKSGNVRVPVIFVRKKSVELNGKAPLILQAYGSYGICQDPIFSITRIPLLERGWIFALAQPRGGGEMGNAWHDAAKVRTKHRTYDDVIAVTDALVKKKITARNNMVLVGGSAGGMMVGAVLNKRPDCVGAGVAYVPAADTLTSMLDESLGGTRLHYDEIGDPRNEKDFLYIKKTSPYHNVKKQKYPPLLVRSSVSDIRTPYWEAAKWVACLREKKTDENVLLSKTEMTAGHFGASGRYNYLKERAWDFAFLISLQSKKP